MGFIPLKLSQLPSPAVFSQGPLKRGSLDLNSYILVTVPAAVSAALPDQDNTNPFTEHQSPVSLELQLTYTFSLEKYWL